MEKAEMNRALTAKSLGIGIVLTVILIALGNLTWLYTSKGEVVTIVLLPFFYFALLNVILGKLGFRLNGAEMTLLFTVTLFAGSLGPCSWGDVFQQYVEKTLVAAGGMLMDPALVAYGRQWVPSYMFPGSELAISAFYNGL